MKINHNDLDLAVRDGVVDQQTADKLSAYLATRPEIGPAFSFTNILYYIGGLIAIGAMTLFMNLGWEAFGGWGILALSLFYGVTGLWLCRKFHRNGYQVPAGICATFVVALVPLAIYGLQQALGYWPEESVYRDYHRYIRWHWLFMELGTLAVGAVLAWWLRYPFMIMPIAVTLWYLSMDVAAMLVGTNPDFELRSLVSMYFGMLMIVIAVWVDVRSRHSADYAFWLYIFGVMAFWGGMSAQSSDSELSKFIYCCINLLMIGMGVVLSRRVFVVFGAIGCAGYLGHLASDIFEDSLLFPISLTAIGLAIIYLGVIWQRNESRVVGSVRKVLPVPVREFLESAD